MLRLLQKATCIVNQRNGEMEATVVRATTSRPAFGDATMTRHDSSHTQCFFLFCSVADLIFGESAVEVSIQRLGQSADSAVEDSIQRLAKQKIL